MPVLIALIALAILLFLFMMTMILFSGAIEGRKRPRDQDRPDAPDLEQRGPDVREGTWPSSKQQGSVTHRNVTPARPDPLAPGGEEKRSSDFQEKQKSKAAAFDDASVPAPMGSEVQVRDAGGESTRDDKTGWDEVDEAVDESFPASDATAKY
jgi:hypothetical protein